MTLVAWVKRRRRDGSGEEEESRPGDASDTVVLHAGRGGGGGGGGESGSSGGGDLISLELEEGGGAEGKERGGRRVGVIQLRGEGVAWKATQSGRWGLAGYHNNATRWFQLALTVSTIQTGGGMPLHCVSRLYLDGRLRSFQSDLPAAGLGCAVPEIRGRPFWVRVGSDGAKGVEIRDLFLYRRALAPEEVRLVSERAPHLSTWHKH